MDRESCARRQEQKRLLEGLNADSTLPQIQRYVDRVVTLRGFSEQSVQETMLLLLEETGELAKAIRKAATQMSIDPDRLHHYTSVESEVADVFFVLTAVCNQMGIDLLAALKEKEETNRTRNWQFTR